MPSGHQDSEVRKLIIWVAASVISLLIAILAFFLTRVLSRMEGLFDEMWSLRQQVTILTYRMDEVQKKQK